MRGNGCLRFRIGGMVAGLLAGSLAGWLLGCGGGGGSGGELAGPLEEATRAVLADWERGIQSGNEALVLAQYGASFQREGYGPRQALEEVERFCQGCRNTFRLRIRSLIRRGEEIIADTEVTVQGSEAGRVLRKARLQFNLGPEGKVLRIRDQNFLGR